MIIESFSNADIFELDDSHFGFDKRGRRLIPPPGQSEQLQHKTVDTQLQGDNHECDSNMYRSRTNTEFIDINSTCAR